MIVASKNRSPSDRLHGASRRRKAKAPRFPSATANKIRRKIQSFPSATRQFARRYDRLCIQSIFQCFDRSALLAGKLLKKRLQSAGGTVACGNGGGNTYGRFSKQ